MTDRQKERGKKRKGEGRGEKENIKSKGGRLTRREGKCSKTWLKLFISFIQISFFAGYTFANEFRKLDVQLWGCLLVAKLHIHILFDLLFFNNL